MRKVVEERRSSNQWLPSGKVLDRITSLLFPFGVKEI